jgi:hypothetical protein
VGPWLSMDGASASGAEGPEFYWSYKTVDGNSNLGGPANHPIDFTKISLVFLPLNFRDSFRPSRLGFQEFIFSGKSSSNLVTLENSRDRANSSSLGQVKYPVDDGNDSNPC